MSLKRGMRNGGFRVSKRGIALLEIMLATAILGIALVSLGIAVGRCVRGLTGSESLHAALDVAEQALVERRLAAFAEGEVKPGSYEGERVVGSRHFSWRQQIEGTEDPDLFRSTLTVRWKEGAREEERNFVSLVARKVVKPPPQTGNP